MVQARCLPRIGGMKLLFFAVVFAASVGPVPAATFHETPSSLVLENASARYELSKEFRGSIVSVEDRLAGADFVAGLPYPAPLFTLTAVAGCAATELSNMDSGELTYRGEVAGSVASLTLVYTALGGSGLDVECSVSLTDASPRAEWRIVVSDASGRAVLRSVSYPLLAVRGPLGDNGADDVLAVPVLDGIALHDPFSSLLPGEGVSGRYPADLSLQMETLYDGSSGLYLAVHDPGGRAKDIGFLRGDIGAVAGGVLVVTHAVEEEPGRGFAQPYPVVLGPFGGDWYDAAMLYADWGRARASCPPPLWQRWDVPAWWKSAVAVISSAAWADDGQAVLPVPLWPSAVQEWTGVTGGPLNLLTFGWEKHGAWTGPDYFPPRDGAAAFGSATSALRAAGSHAFVYVSGTTWRLGRRELPSYDDTERFLQEGAPWAAQTCDGSPLYDGFYASIGWPTARMCPATDAWQAAVADNVATAAGLGVDAVSVDEFPIGSIYPCYATSHGHAAGSGSWQGSAYRELLARARAEGRAANPNLALTCEEPNELYLDLLDGYVSRDNQPDGFYGSYLARFGAAFEVVPLFAAVYHDRSLAVAEPTVAYDAVGAMDVLRTSYARGITAALTLGKVPSAAVVAPAQADPELAALFARVARLVAGRAHEFVVLGTMLRPPVLDVPRIDFDWLYTDLVAGQVDLRTQTAPAVLAGAFRSPGGNLAVVLANISSQRRTVDVPLPAPELPPPYTVYLDDGSGYRVLTRGRGVPGRVAVELGPRAVAMVGVVAAVPAPDRPPRLSRRLVADR